MTSPFSPNLLDEEDCSYLLRELEITAFSTVVSAMRAQGAFNKFKEVLLENLKLSLFISDEQYKSEVKRAANDEHLQRISQILNPCYDTFSGWGVLSIEPDDDCLIVPKSRWFDRGSTRSTADSLLLLANGHNESMTSQDVGLVQLLQLPKKPYVPERLRLLLRDTESIHTDRILPREVDNELADSPFKATPKAAPKPRRRKPKAAAAAPTEVKEESQEPSTSAEVPMSEAASGDLIHKKDKESTKASSAGPPLLSPQKLVAESAIVSECLASSMSSKEAESLGVKEFLNKIQQQIQEEARTGVPEQTARRKRKPKQPVQKEVSGACDCARARPFLFEPQINGIKPPRGNPDKRWGLPKRSPTSSSSICFSPPPQTPSQMTPTQPSPSLSNISSLSSGVPPMSDIGSDDLHQPLMQRHASPSTSSESISSPNLAASAHIPAGKEPITVPGSAMSFSSASLPTIPLPSVAVIRRQPSPSTSGNHLVPTASKAATPQQQTPVQNVVYKRPRVGSFTESSSSSADYQQLQQARTQANTIKMGMGRPSQLAPSSVSAGKLKYYQQEATASGSGSAAYNNPTRTYYGNPSVAALNRNQSQVHVRAAAGGGGPVGPASPSPSPSSASSAQSQSAGSTGTAASFDTTTHGHDYNTPRPVIKRSVFKTGSVRIMNGAAISQATVVSSGGISGASAAGAPPSHSHSRLPSHSPTLTAGSSPISSTTAPSSPSTGASYPVVRRFVPLPPHNPQMPVGQFLMRKSSCSTFSPSSSSTAAATVPVDPAPPPPKRVYYCDPAQGTYSVSQDTSDSSFEPSTSEVHYVNNGSASASSSTDQDYSKLDGSVSEMMLMSSAPGTSSQLRHERDTTPTSLSQRPMPDYDESPQVVHRILKLLPPLEKSLPSDSPSSVRQPQSIQLAHSSMTREPAPMPVPHPHQHQPQRMVVMSDAAAAQLPHLPPQNLHQAVPHASSHPAEHLINPAPSGHSESGDDDRPVPAVAVVTDILQQSMMEIS